ncbi:Aldose reductase B [Toxocara canis]|nr:Aldose reductase B [Toxocara canis]
MSLATVAGGVAKLNTGLPFPLVGLGTYKVTGQETITAVVDAALKAGYRMFDTAKYYHNEPELGNALQELLPKYGLKREDIYITTKFFPAAANNAEFARKMVDESLRDLKTSYIDLMLIHYPKAEACANDDPRNVVNRHDAYVELEKIKAEGKIRSVGVSNYEINHLEEIKQFGKMMPAVNQVEFHPHFTRQPLHDYCDKEGIFFQAFSSLARNHEDLIGDPVIVRVAEKHKTSPQLILLAWAHNIGVGIVPKSASPSRVIENFKVVDLKLSQEELDEISKLNRDKHYIRCEGWNVL